VYIGRLVLVLLYETLFADIVTTGFAIPSFLFIVYWITVLIPNSLYRSFTILSIPANSVTDIKNVISAD
jgi:ABC-type microcin C transport system permease subunit YejB